MKAVIYARYSTDKQSKESVEDQFLICHAYAERHGWSVIERYGDEAISGAAIGNRPAFLRMIAAGKAREFDVLVVADLTRFSRNAGDLNKELERLTFRGVRVIGVQDGYDSARKGSKMQAGLSGIIGPAFIEMVSEKVTAKGHILHDSGCSVGGRAFGYESVVLPGGRKWWGIVPERAEWVRWIFKHYAAGWSPRRIAAELNALGVPSPGASWARKPNADGKRSDGKWLASTINGGILSNALYNGEYVWNRVQWRKHPDSGIRVVVARRPPEEWKRRPCPELRIVPQGLWAKVQARRESRKSAVTAAACTTNGGGRVKYILSGLLTCGECGSRLVIADSRKKKTDPEDRRQHTYACASHTNGGMHACANDRRIPRDILEQRVIGTLQTELLTPERIERFRKRLAQKLNDRTSNFAAADAARRRKLAEAEQKVENIMAAIEQGIVTPTTKERLIAAEAERDGLGRERPAAPKVVRMLPGAVSRYQDLVAELPRLLAKDPDRARDILRRLLVALRVIREKNGTFIEIATSPERLLGLAGFTPREARDCGGSGGRI